MEDRLYKFARLVDAGSYTKAARLMHISQPALTTAIQKLERELHAELLVRSNRTFYLTDAGKIAYQTAKDIGLQAENLRTRLASSEGTKPMLRLGLIDSLADMLFVHGGALEPLEQHTQLALSVDNSSRLIQLVEHDDLDLAFIAKPSHVPAALTALSLGNEPLVLVTHTNRISEVDADIRRGVLAGFLAYNHASHTYKLVADTLGGMGVELQPAFYSTSPQIMLALVLAGKGTAALPYLLVKQHVESGVLRQVTAIDCVLPREIIAIYRQGRVLPEAGVSLLRSTQAELAAISMSL